MHFTCLHFRLPIYHETLFGPSFQFHFTMRVFFFLSTFSIFNLISANLNNRIAHQIYTLYIIFSHLTCPCPHNLDNRKWKGNSGEEKNLMKWVREIDGNEIVNIHLKSEVRNDTGKNMHAHLHLHSRSHWKQMYSCSSYPNGTWPIKSVMNRSCIFIQILFFALSFSPSPVHSVNICNLNVNRCFSRTTRPHR